MNDACSVKFLKKSAQQRRLQGHVLGGRYECGRAAHTSFVVCGGIKVSETKLMLRTSYIIGLYIFLGRGELRYLKWEAIISVNLGQTSNKQDDKRRSAHGPSHVVYLNPLMHNLLHLTNYSNKAHMWRSHVPNTKEKHIFCIQNSPHFVSLSTPMIFQFCTCPFQTLKSMTLEAQKVFCMKIGRITWPQWPFEKHSKFSYFLPPGPPF